MEVKSLLKDYFSKFLLWVVVLFPIVVGLIVGFVLPRESFWNSLANVITVSLPMVFLSWLVYDYGLDK